MKNLLAAGPLALLAILGSLPAAHAQTAAAPYRVVGTILIGGEGGWDFLYVDPAGERLYVSHATQVEVLDLKTKKVIGTVANTPGGST
ncbi:MAG: hypothetical protein EOO59_07880 [Hymenobacter sp.]|nr:MAG: hypothetical protein EOO59_07880 [Hymenobacter sp.]